MKPFLYLNAIHRPSHYLEERCENLHLVEGTHRSRSVMISLMLIKVSSNTTGEGAKDVYCWGNHYSANNEGTHGVEKSESEGGRRADSSKTKQP